MYRKEFRLPEFPSIKFFKDEFPYTYDGGNNAVQMASWIRRRIRGRMLPTEEVASIQELGEMIQRQGARKGGVFLFFGNTNSSNYKKFAKAGKKYTD